MNSSLLPKVIANLAKHEGRSMRMYPDTVGVVTCGIGHAIFTPQAALALGFLSSGLPASGPSILADYTCVKHHILKVGNLLLPVAAQELVETHDTPVSSPTLSSGPPKSDPGLGTLDHVSPFQDSTRGRGISNAIAPGVLFPTATQKLDETQDTPLSVAFRPS